MCPPDEKGCCVMAVTGKPTLQRGLRPGQLVRVPVDERTHTYGRLLSAQPYVAFYDCRTEQGDPPSLEIVACPVLFVLATMFQDPVKEGRWVPLGIVPLSEFDVEIPPRFHVSVGRPDLSIIDQRGNVRPATPAECVGLERARGWTRWSVEERLRDHYEGRTHRLVEIFRVDAWNEARYPNAPGPSGRVTSPDLAAPGLDPGGAAPDGEGVSALEAWGSGSVENDDARAFLTDLEDVEHEQRLPLVVDALQDVVNTDGYLQVDQSNIAIAAAALVADARAGERTSGSGASSTLLKPASVTPELRALAVQALERAIGSDSEWSELWGEGDALERVRALSNALRT